MVNLTSLGHCWKYYFSRAKVRQLSGHIISQGGTEHALHLLPGAGTGVGATGGEASSALATFLQSSSCFCFQVPQKAHEYVRNSCIRETLVCWIRPWASFCKFWNRGQVSMTEIHHHLPVLLSAAGGLTCVIAVPWKCGGKRVFLIYPEDNVLNKLCSC